MKNYTFLVLFWFAFNVSMGQNNLPEPIVDFYAKYNFVNTFSTQKEVAKLSFYLDDKQLPPELSSKRLKQVHQYLQDINKNLYRAEGMPNATKSSPSSVMLGYLEINDWEIDGDVIYVYTTSYHFEEPAKRFFINQYDQLDNGENIPEFKKFFEKGLMHGNPVTQTWFRANGEWKKGDINKILVNLN